MSDISEKKKLKKSKKKLDLYRSFVVRSGMRERKEMKNLKHFNPMALREKYSVGSLNKKNNYSSFWLDNDWDNTGSIFDDEDVKPKVDLIALSSYRRAIANFVNILTKKDIPVTFATAGASVTDGKKVTISAKLDDKLFDSSVGLALHEGSHILLSDFDMVRNLEVNIPKEYFNRAEVKGFSKMEILSHIKNLLNYVEDRRIDNYVFSNSPGYKGYYHSMYKKYFHSKIIDKALGTDEYTDNNWDSYMFRVINLTNKNTNLNALDGLRKIYTSIFKDNGGVKNIKSTDDAFKVALKVYDVILNNIPDGIENVNSETGEISYEKADGSDSSDEGNESSGGESDDKYKGLNDDEFDSLLDSIKEGESSESGNGGASIDLPGKSSSNENVEGTQIDIAEKKIELTDAQKRQLVKAFEKQKKFMDGDITKKKVSKKDKASLDAVESAGMEYREVGKNLTNYYTGKNTPTKVIVVKNFNKGLVDSDTVGMISKWQGDNYGTDGYRDTYIEDGVRLGTILGRKLQVRGESRDTKYTRKLNGRIDKRLIAELGFDNQNVFSQTFVDSYPDAHLHISVDASGSMSGDKWTKTMTSVVAMAKAIDMISNVDLVISFRSTQDNGGYRYRRSSSDNHPIILIAYDSRKDSFTKVKTLFKYLGASGTTPEGLCYEAIMNDMIPSGRDKDSYFLNFSDGMPMFGNKDIDYHHDTAINHTKKMVKEIRNRGIKVLSYFIGSSYERQDSTSAFNRMYGSDAQFIDVTSVMSVSKTMNKTFLKK